MRAPSGRGVGDVLTDIAHNLERLVRAHVHLEAAGVLEAAAATTRGVGLLAVGVVLALVAALLVLLSAVASMRLTSRFGALDRSVQLGPPLIGTATTVLVGARGRRHEVHRGSPYPSLNDRRAIRGG